jgi:hypothetical protein
MRPFSTCGVRTDVRWYDQALFVNEAISPEVLAKDWHMSAMTGM